MDVGSHIDSIRLRWPGDSHRLPATCQSLLQALRGSHAAHIRLHLSDAGVYAGDLLHLGIAFIRLVGTGDRGRRRQTLAVDVYHVRRTGSTRSAVHRSDECLALHEAHLERTTGILSRHTEVHDGYWNHR